MERLGGESEGVEVKKTQTEDVKERTGLVAPRSCSGAVQWTQQAADEFHNNTPIEANPIGNYSDRGGWTPK